MHPLTSIPFPNRPAPLPASPTAQPGAGAERRGWHRVAGLSLIAALAFGLAACGGDPAAEAPAPVPPQSAKFTLELSADKLVLNQASLGTLRVTVTRAAGFTEAVSVDLSGLPEGVIAAPVIVAAGATSADITLAAGAMAPHSLPTQAKATGHAAGETAQRSLTVTVRGLAGALDTSFAGGKVITPVGTGEDYAKAVAVQADGKVVVAGSSAVVGGTRLSLVRYQRDGALDAGFGNGGKVLVSVGARGNDAANAVAVQADGKIVVAGASDQGASGLDFVLLRFNADGTPDAGFGNGGQAITDFGSDSDRAWAVLVMADGKIVVGGETNSGVTSGGTDFAVARYRPDGTLDAGFGQGGRVVTAVKSATGTDIVRALAVQIVRGGERLLAVGGEGDFLAVRYTSAGALDASFGVNGKVVGLFNANIGAAHAVTVLPTGEAVLAGHIGHNFAAVQLTEDGLLDNRFGSGASGRFLHAVSESNWDEATTIVRQADGKLLLGGWVYSGNSSAGDFVALRLTADGMRDADFGTNGISIVPMAEGTRNDQGRAMVLQADDRIPSVRALIAGEAGGSNHDFALARLWL